MKTLEVAKAEPKKNPHGVDVRNIYDTENAVVSHILMRPGESLKKHITPVDVAFYVLEGKGIVEIGEEQREMIADTIIESPARIPHRWINNSQGDLRILVIKAPRQKEPSKLL